MTQVEKKTALTDTILLVKNLRVYFFAGRRVVKAVDGVSLEVERAETVGIAGESGCGKSTLARSIMQVVPPPGRIVSGEIFFRGIDLLGMSDRDRRKIRGDKIGIIFQDPSTFLNPTIPVGMQICDVILAHHRLSRKQARRKAEQLLEEVGIPEPALRFHSYPHELSGGMKQRVLIAMAISCDPELVIADEPTTALDVTIQRQILELIKRKIIRKEHAVLFISHDLSILAEICNRIYVMYAGKVIEQAKTIDLFQTPFHPYTHKLLSAIPRHDVKRLLVEIKGSPPSLDDLPNGCSFEPRCDSGTPKCREEEPQLKKVGNTHFVRCHNVQGEL
ncbi:ABC transporter ATP-binding protein [candidate division WOR-3 bacterium]|nr:ABC transporter ATP-binding protein [candidate division WOR-3 bacterium]